MTTVNDVAQQALKKSGVIGDGQSIGGSDMSDAIADLSDMLAQWNEKRWLVWHLLDVSVLSSGVQTYTVGPGGQFNVNPRPSRLEAAYVRQIVSAGLNVDFPLIVLPSMEEYSRIALKSLVSFPKFAFLDTASPIANLHLYPVPNAAIYEIHIIVKDVWPLSINQATSFDNYPPVAIPAMKFNLARRLRQAYGKGLRPDTELNKLAQDALDTVRNAQVQVPELVMPTMLVRPLRYNIYSDQTY